MEKNEIKVPTSIEEAVDQLIAGIKPEDRERIAATSEEKLGARLHMFLGRAIRNDWNLWWFENAPENYGWPSTPGPLVQEFIDLGIWHGDDRSAIIITSVYRKLRGTDLDLPGQAQHYIDFWKKQNRGFGGKKIDETSN